MDYKNGNILTTTFVRNVEKSFMMRTSHDTCSYCDNLPIYTFTDFKDGQSMILGCVCDKHFKLGQVKLQLVNRKAKQRKRDKRKKTEAIKVYRREKKKKRKLSEKNTP